MWNSRCEAACVPPPSMALWGVARRRDARRSGLQFGGRARAWPQDGNVAGACKKSHVPHENAGVTDGGGHGTHGACAHPVGLRGVGHWVALSLPRGIWAQPFPVTLPPRPMMRAFALAASASPIFPNFTCIWESAVQARRSLGAKSVAIKAAPSAGFRSPARIKAMPSACHASKFCGSNSVAWRYFAAALAKSPMARSPLASSSNSVAL